VKPIHQSISEPLRKSHALERLFLADGEVYRDQASADAALAAATTELVRNEFVAPYLFEVREVDGKIVPVKEREIIRAAGPTVHRHTGKQAGQVHA